MMQILWILGIARQTQVALSRYRTCIYFITYQLILPVVTCNLYIINYKFGLFVTCSFRKYSTLDNRKPSCVCRGWIYAFVHT